MKSELKNLFKKYFLIELINNYYSHIEFFIKMYELSFL